MASLTTTAQSPFDVYVSEVSRDAAKFPASEETRRIQEDVNSISEGLVSALEQKWKMFKGARLIKAGSMQDQLRISAPDEYDFMIELPAIDKSVITFTFDDDESTECASIHVQNYDFFGDVYKVRDKQDIESDDIQPGDEDYDLYLDLLNDHKISDLMSGVQRTVEKFIAEYLEKVDMPGWAGHPEHYEAEGDFGRGAITPYLLWSGVEYHKLTVSVDYTLAVPKQMSDEEPSRLPRHYILRRGAECRFSCALLEQEFLSQYSVDSTEKRLIRIVKYIVGNFLPKYYSESIQDMHSSVTSYAIKNVFFHMVHTRPKSDWIIDNLGHLVFELIRSILKHANQRNLQCYYMPGYNIFQKFKQIDAYAAHLEESGHTEDDEEGYLSEAHQNLERSIEALECLVKLIERSVEGDESAVTKIKDTIEQASRVDAETKQRKIEEHVIEMLYTYCSEGYPDSVLLNTKQFISKNNLSMFKVSGQGDALTLTRDGSVVDLDQLFRMWYQYSWKSGENED